LILGITRSVLQKIDDETETKVIVVVVVVISGLPEFLQFYDCTPF